MTRHIDDHEQFRDSVMSCISESAIIAVQNALTVDLVEYLDNRLYFTDARGAVDYELRECVEELFEEDI